MLTYSYTALRFLYPFFAGYYTNITVSSCNTKRISSLEKSLSKKYVHIPGCQKNGAFHIGIQKNRAIHILFVKKRGQIIYLASLKKGAIRHAHPYYAIYRKFPTPRPPPPPPPPPWNNHDCDTVQLLVQPFYHSSDSPNWHIKPDMSQVMRKKAIQHLGSQISLRGSMTDLRTLYKCICFAVY